MEKINFNYSLKNIPIPSNNQYLKCLLDKLNSFVRRIRWKAFFFDNKVEKNENIIENFGFKSELSPPRCKDLIAFENDLYDMVRKIEFRKINNTFLRDLSKDVKTIRESNEIYVAADKTTNMYKLSAKNYDKLLQENITAKYKKTNSQVMNEITSEAKKISEDLKLDDRIEKTAEKHAFITIKDHKENFPNNLKCRLINPAKTNIGKVSKQLLDKINNEIRSTTNLQQWKNTDTVITWFKEFKANKKHKFLSFDVVDFYPSISERLLKNALAFAKNFMNIDEKTIEIILHSKKSLLFSKEGTWMKKTGNLFDITMGSYDGAETCELVGLYLLHQLSKHINPKNVGLYRDDGLAILENTSGPRSEQIRKQIIKIFKENGLQITTETNLQQINFLDVTLNLETGKYWPFRKPNSQPIYIHKSSNHPPNIKEQIPNMINDRISKLSCNHQEFQNAIPEYKEALEKSGYKTNFVFKNNTTHNQNNRRKRKIIWFNPPYSDHVQTNIGKTFFNVLKKHFPSNHRYHKIFNKNNIKLSYSCMPNMESLIAGHNKKILANEKKMKEKACNCKFKEECPMNGQCRTKSIIYKATIESQGNTKHYIGCSETEFKTRFYNHKQSFKNPNKRNATELSKSVWNNKDAGYNPKITWSIITKTIPYQPGARTCQLCLTEKLAILQADPTTTLNKRSELYGKCRHKNKFKLKNLRL